jgi:hypothetical protein
MGSPTSDDDPTPWADRPGGLGGWSGPPPGGDRSNRGLVIALVGGLVILAALGAALVYAFPRDGGETVSAGRSTTPGTAPTSSSFYLYADTATLDDVFADDARAIDPMPEGRDCSTAEGVTAWKAGGVERGEIACVITGDGLVIAWTDRRFGIEGVVTAPGSTPEDLAELADWWRGHSEFRR